MKKHILLLAIFIAATTGLLAQVSSTDGSFTADGTTDLTLQTGTTNRLTILNGSGFVGIGTNPSEMLHVNGKTLSDQFTAIAGTFNSFGSSNLSLSTNGNSRLTVQNSNGFVGIGLGATAPTEMLQVAGKVSATHFLVSTGNFNSTDPNNLFLQTNGTNRLTILNSNGFVGIGTSAPPSEMLHVNGNVLSNQFSSATGNFASAGASNLSLVTNGNSRLTVLNSNGFVGIGVAIPQQMLHISGGNVVVDNGTPTIYMGTGSSELNRYLQVSNSTGLQSPSGLKAGGLLVSDTYNYANPSKNDLIVKGKVAIGTPLASNPYGYTLAVNGKIGAKDVQIETSSAAWPDFVFEENYHLPTLYEVEQYIQENKHLQDVPSAKQIEEKHSLGEMDAVLLKKIEELTLYVIEQQKQIDELKKKLDKK